MESAKLDASKATRYVGPSDPMVGRASWSDGAVWLDKIPSKKKAPKGLDIPRLEGVPEYVWEFEVGGHQVCQKWLKVRRGRRLAPEDVAHLERIVVAVVETIAVTTQIDAAIDAHGGWPGAFLISDEAAASR